MNTPASSGHTAVICEPHDDNAAALEAYLQSRGLTDAEWFGPRDVDDVQRGLRAGTIRRVVLPGVSEFLDMLWDGVLDVELWLRADAWLELVESPPADPAEHLRQIVGSWQRSRRARRRRQIVAGLVLSAVAVLAAFALLAVGS